MVPKQCSAWVGCVRSVQGGLQKQVQCAEGVHEEL